jgi:hypothetical protein
MVLIQLLLPTNGPASADGLAPLAQTRRELADRFTGVTRRMSDHLQRDCGRLLTGRSNRTTSSWWKS